MSLWIKICGITSLEDARLASESGADAVGFVFAPSPRHVTTEQVAAITAHLPSSVEKIGVFVDARLDEIAPAIELSGLTGVQLHSSCGTELPQQLKQRFGGAFKVLRVLHFGPNAPDDVMNQAADADSDPNIDAVLVDSRTATAVGGTGVAFDWRAASQTLFRNSPAQKPRIAAGGLNPSNVAEAIETLHPWGVDAVSGVEIAPGRKDPAKVRAFIANARAKA